MDNGIGDLHKLGYDHGKDGVEYAEYIVLGTDNNYFRCSLREKGNYINGESVPPIPSSI